MTVEEADVRTNMLLCGENRFKLESDGHVNARRNMQKRIWKKTKQK